MRKHTAGPWRIVDLRHQKNGQIQIVGTSMDIANVLARNTQAEANAALIASAPDLLHALQWLVNACDAMPSLVSIPEAVEAAARAAIAKAQP